MRLLLGYATTRTGRPPSRLDLADLDAALIGGFLDHLERERGNSVRTRNVRLAAIHSLFRFAALAHPEHAESIARVLAIPPKRFDRSLISYLTEPEVDALLGCCDPATWTGRRDQFTLGQAVIGRSSRDQRAGSNAGRRGVRARRCRAASGTTCRAGTTPGRPGW